VEVVDLQQSLHRSTVGIVIPTNYLVGHPWQLGLLKDKEAGPVTVETLTLHAGPYSILDVLSLIEKQTGRTIVWCRSIRPGSEDEETVKRKLFQRGAEHREGMLLRWERPQQKLRDVLDIVLGFMTEVGVARESPRHEVWVAILTQRYVFLTMLPTWYEAPVPRPE